MKINILLGLVFAGLISCNSDKIPSSILSPEELEPVIWDLMAAGEMRISDTTKMTRLHIKDSTTASFQYVLQIHHLDKRTFFESYRYYEHHPEKQEVLIDSLIAFNERKIKALDKNKSTKPKLVAPSKESPVPVPLPIKKL